MYIRKLSDNKIEDYKSLGVNLTHELIIDSYIYEIDSRTANWIECAIKFGKREAKRELKEWLNFNY